jgi:hypothetical protein
MLLPRFRMIRLTTFASQCTLRLIDHSMIIQDAMVVRNVDGLGLHGERRMDALGLGVPLVQRLGERRRHWCGDKCGCRWCGAHPGASA